MYTQKLYEEYIYGSAEVIGLMCLRIFVHGDTKKYETLKAGASALGAAYQKVNFLRDIASDYTDRGRVYFPGVTFESFNNADKQAIIADIEHDFLTAEKALSQLPNGAKRAVHLSYLYYRELLKTLRLTPAATLKSQRVRVSDSKKASLALRRSFGFMKGPRA
jgi:phytoene/squalene synthetase